ncbi:hypothetical protein GALL_377770 [mine drainage metagenome]|uniref:Uncharacterized protein n=1 Tax=mine drainage metagenome TaxID=410659 RepID=A0A1J5QBA5_9ZZZZ
MALGAAGNDAQAALHQHRGHHAGVGHDLLLIELEILGRSFLESHGLGGDDMHQRAALDVGENRRVERLFMLA